MAAAEWHELSAEIGQCSALDRRKNPALLARDFLLGCYAITDQRFAAPPSCTA
jgi:hypothetical protein